MDELVIVEERAPSAPWAALRARLWPESSAAEHRTELRDVLDDPDAAAFLARRGERAVGFAEVTARAAPAGLAPGRVGYLEGIWVAPEARRAGLGRALVARARSWARERGCERFASDTEPGNLASRAFHRALGFRETPGEALVLFEWEGGR